MSADARVIVAGTFRARDGVTDAIRAAMEAMAQASRSEEGCEIYSYAVDVFDPTLVRVFEIWRDARCLAAHRIAPHLFAWRAKWPALGLGEADLSTYDIGAEKKL
jgi:quinol monooxygenase YgiN